MFTFLPHHSGDPATSDFGAGTITFFFHVAGIVIEPSIMMVLGGETFSLPIHARDAFDLSPHDADILPLPAHPGDTFRC
jgi:hypothetical protein